MDPGDDGSLVLFVGQVAKMKVPIIKVLILLYCGTSFEDTADCKTTEFCPLAGPRSIPQQSSLKDIGTNIVICRRLLLHLVMFRFDAE